MTALTQERDTSERAGLSTSNPVAAGKTIYAGSIVVLNATGYAEAATTATGLVARGRASATVDNTNGADGDSHIEVDAGVFHYANSGDIDRTHIGSTVYLVDDQTISATDGTGTQSAAGTLIDVDADGVWVDIK